MISSRLNLGVISDVVAPLSLIGFIIFWSPSESKEA
jgi:hypothetical protein